MKLISVFLVILVGIETTSCTGPQHIHSSMQVSNGQIVAHRGAFKTNGYPENSIAALKEAIRLGCAGSEFDVRMTADDSLVINHDPRYHELEIEKETYATLSKYYLSNGEKLPTLREYILAGLADNAATRLVCEIKPSGINTVRSKKIASSVVSLISKLNAAKKVIYISFDFDILKQVLKDKPSANTQYLAGDKSPDELKQNHIRGANYHYSVFQQKPGWITTAKQLNIELNAWTVNNASEMDWLLANGFQYITTNEPEQLAERIKASPASKKWHLVWSDEFNYRGLPDSTKWKFDVGGNGWGNNELQYYTYADTNNAIVKSGSLYITALQEKIENNSYSSAKLITKGTQLFRYGKIEVRARLPKGRGTWPAIWMLGGNIDTVGWPDCGEIDIMEHVGFNPDSVFGSVHTKRFNHIIGTQTTKGISISNPYSAFHTYSVEWTPEKISFLVDEVRYLDFLNQHQTEAEWPFSKPFYLILNLAVGGNWGGQKGIDQTIFPATLEVDYVRVFEKK